MNENLGETRFIRRKSGRSTSAGPATSRPMRELPPDLLLEASRRLQILALIFAVCFFMANFFPALLAGVFGELMSSFKAWGPGTISIVVGLTVFALARNPRIPPRRLMDIGLVFSVFGSYGIAVAQYLGPFSQPDITLDQLAMFGLSWVAVWMVVVPIMIPNLPRKTLLATLGSASAVPVTIGLILRYTASGLVVAPMAFFLNVIFPYLLCGAMTYAAARIVGRLGSEVTRAREMGSYELTEMLGRGGMGEVWRAQHRMLARPAAIKLVRPEVLGAADTDASRVALKRFAREAQATATMRSPHTIGLYDFGITDDGTFYYVMELLDGFDLESLVQRFGPLEPERVVHLLTQACHSLGEAHECGLIHRDIKPANIYVCRHGREVDFVKVLDFGLVKTQQETRTPDPALTAANVAGGTPTFMAPEQALGTHPVDGRTDIYALGCVGYWLLTGQLVFTGETAIQTIMQHVNAVPEPPSVRTELPIPPALDRLILSCLEKEPEHRPANADQLAEMLATCDTEDNWTRERAQRWWETHRPPQKPAGQAE